MELKRTGYGPKIALASAFAALVLGYESFVAAHLITAGSFDAFWSLSTLASAFSLLVIAAITYAIWANVHGLIVRRRRALALAQRDPSVVTEALLQPDPSLALSAGETLTLTYRYSLGTVFNSLALVVFFYYLVIASEVVIFQALPSFGHSSLNPYFNSQFDGPTGPSPSILDWLAAALPVLLVACVFGYLLWCTVRDRIQQIVANDTGISIRNGLGRRGIRWGDIVVFARITEGTEIAPVGSYVLWTRTQSLNFSIVVMEEQIDSDADHGQSAQIRYTFDGGYAAYIQGAQRQLATIAARAHTPLLTMHVTSPGRSQRRGVVAIAALGEEDVQSLPLADAQYAPHDDRAGTPLTDGEELSLRLSAHTTANARNWMSDVYVGFTLLYILGWSSLSSNILWPFVLVTVVSMILLLAIYVMLIIRARRAGRRPDVSVNEVGLTTWGRYKGQPITIPWPSVTAWVVMRPAKPEQPARYVVFGDGLRLSWTELPIVGYPWRDGNSEYRNRAERLHALIAARTGLPLRELRADALPVGQA